MPGPGPFATLTPYRVFSAAGHSRAENTLSDDNFILFSLSRRR